MLAIVFKIEVQDISCARFIFGFAQHTYTISISLNKNKNDANVGQYVCIYIPKSILYMRLR